MKKLFTQKKIIYTLIFQQILIHFLFVLFTFLRKFSNWRKALFPSSLFHSCSFVNFLREGTELLDNRCEDKSICGLLFFSFFLYFWMSSLSLLSSIFYSLWLSLQLCVFLHFLTFFDLVWFQCLFFWNANLSDSFSFPTIIFLKITSSVENYHNYSNCK